MKTKPGAFVLLFVGLFLFGCVSNGGVTPTGTPTPVTTISPTPTPSISEQPPGPPEGLGDDGLPTLPSDSGEGLNTSEEPPDILD